MKRLLIAFALLAASPAYAKDVTLTLTDTEQQQLMALLDLAVKQGGIQAATAVSFFVQKLRTEQQKQAEPSPTTTLPESVKPKE